MKIILTVSLLLSINSVLSQENDNYNLKDYTWKLLNTDEDFKFTFSNNEFTTYFDGSILGKKSEYYLSDSNCKNKTFDHSKLGLDLEGEYLISEEGCFIINYISKNKVELTPVGNYPNPDTITLEAL